MPSPRGKLPRLNPQAYQGTACVHWIMTMDRRATGWLTEVIHQTLREILVHASVRSRCVCPVYCLMPDHGHFLVLGAHAEADARTWARIVRTHWNAWLKPHHRLQRQAYDHVLREAERARDAFASIAHYILENPVRANLVEDAASWRFSGSIFPGFYDLDFRQPGFWDRFWEKYYRALEIEAEPNFNANDVP